MAGTWSNEALLTIIPLVGIVKQENRLGLLFHTLKYLVFFCFKKDLCDTRESMPNEEDVIPYFAAEGRPSRA